MEKRTKSQNDLNQPKPQENYQKHVLACLPVAKRGPATPLPYWQPRSKWGPGAPWDPKEIEAHETRPWVETQFCGPHSGFHIR